MNIYRVYSDPKGSDQRIVVAPDGAVAVSAVDLVDRENAKCVHIRELPRNSRISPNWIVADADGFKIHNQ